MIKAVELVLLRTKYYSETIKKCIQNKFNDIIIDNFDRQILYHLSMGEKTKDICKYIPLSNRAIEVRKNKLKVYLLSNDGGSSNLVKEAKKLGII
ncbi:hypothetical protein A8C32_14580 [Flavivirga aquatica]|uniref:HTH luxR-type domain-containing protein n=1 Tax=Flavivirga aquatica TaxID=1849968 RepID=A0A1E5TCL2_9FLAO|nr:hypothetical protein [Flavivirga aquatica]OEK09106.1 hypothetical protein A8C32_14580 [Flavivirga aquatica]